MIAKVGAVVALLFGIAAAVLPTVTVPSDAQWPPLEMTWRTTTRTGSTAAPLVITAASQMSFTDDDTWSTEVVASDDTRAGAIQVGERTEVDGQTVTFRPCEGCAQDERTRTNEAIPAAVSPAAYGRYADDPAVAKQAVDAPLGLNLDAVRVETAIQYPCAGVLAECAPGAPGAPAGLAGGNAPAVEYWTFVILDADRQSAVPVRHQVRIGDLAVEDTVVDSLEIPSS